MQKKGTMDVSAKFLTKSGHVVDWQCRQVVVYGANGEVKFVIGNFFALRYNIFIL